VQTARYSANAQLICELPIVRIEEQDLGHRVSQGNRRRTAGGAHHGVARGSGLPGRCAPDGLDRNNPAFISPDSTRSLGTNVFGAESS